MNKDLKNPVAYISSEGTHKIKDVHTSLLINRYCTNMYNVGLYHEGYVSELLRNITELEKQLQQSQAKGKNAKA